MKGLTSDHRGNIRGTNRNVSRQKRRYAKLRRLERADADVCHCDWWQGD